MSYKIHSAVEWQLYEELCESIETDFDQQVDARVSEDAVHAALQGGVGDVVDGVFDLIGWVSADLEKLPTKIGVSVDQEKVRQDAGR